MGRLLNYFKLRKSLIEQIEHLVDMVEDLEDRLSIVTHERDKISSDIRPKMFRITGDSIPACCTCQVDMVWNNETGWICPLIGVEHD